MLIDALLLLAFLEKMVNMDYSDYWLDLNGLIYGMSFLKALKH